MSDHKDRPRKMDLSKMSTEQADAISAQIGKELARIMDEANAKCNEMLNIYGMQTQINYQIVQLAKKTEEKPKASKRMKKAPKGQSLDKLQE